MLSHFTFIGEPRYLDLFPCARCTLLFVLNFIFHSFTEIDSLSRLQLMIKNKNKPTFILKAVAPAREFACFCWGVLRRKSRSVAVNEDAGQPPSAGSLMMLLVEAAVLSAVPESCSGLGDQCHPHLKTPFSRMGEKNVKSWVFTKG